MLTYAVEISRWNPLGPLLFDKLGPNQLSVTSVEIEFIGIGRQYYCFNDKWCDVRVA